MRLAQPVHLRSDLRCALGSGMGSGVHFDVVRAVTVNEVGVSSCVADSAIATLSLALLDDMERDLHADEPGVESVEGIQIAPEVGRVIDDVVEDDVVALAGHRSNGVMHPANESVEDVSGTQDQRRTGRTVMRLHTQSLLGWVARRRVQRDQPVGKHRYERIDAGSEEWARKDGLQLGGDRGLPGAGDTVQEDNVSGNHRRSLRQHAQAVKSGKRPPALAQR
jgi:hypothetical protein